MAQIIENQSKTYSIVIIRTSVNTVKVTITLKMAWQESLRRAATINRGMVLIKVVYCAAYLGLIVLLPYLTLQVVHGRISTLSDSNHDSPIKN